MAFITPMFVMDADNDGRQELYISPADGVVQSGSVWQKHTPNDSTYNYWLSPTASEIPFVRYAPSYSLSDRPDGIGWSDFDQWNDWQKALVMDINGDGVKDLVTRKGPEQDPSMEVRFAQSRLRLRMTAITDGMGQRIDIRV